MVSILSSRKSVRRLGLAGGCLVPLSLAACTPAPPAHPDDICSVFHEKRGWYHAALRQEKKWNVPFSVPMAIMYQESGYHSNLHTKRTYILWFIPWGYVTTAYGYPQAKTDIWQDYQKATDTSASRENFADSLDFINWYVTNTRKQNRVPVTDGMRQYLAYHEGWGGYRKRSYASKGWLMTVARKVGARANVYAAQYASCENDLKDKGFWSWLF